jgi:O-antigen ligase
VIGRIEINGRSAIALVLVAFAPLIFALLTASTTFQPSGFVDFARFFGLPIAGIELIVVLLALAQGVRIFDPIRRAAPWQRLCIGALIIIAAATALFVAQVKAPAMIRTSEWLIHLLFGLSIFGLAKEAPESAPARRIWVFIAAGLLCYAAALALFVALLPDPARFNWEALHFGLVSVRQIGTYSGAGFGVAIALAVLARTTWAQIGWTVAAAVLIGLSFWSGTRNSIAAVLGVLAFGFVLLPPMRQVKAVAMATAALVGGFAVAHVHLPPVLSFQVTRFYAPVPAETAAKTDLSSGRTTMWQVTAKEVLDRPLFGHGESQFRVHPVTRQFNLFHPHNSVIQIAFQWGVVGALCFFALFTVLWFKLLRAARQAPDRALPAFLTVNILFAISLIDGAYYYTWSPMISAFALAIALAKPANEGAVES